MGEIKNTQGATSGEVRALAEGDAAFASSSLRDGDPSREDDTKNLWCMNIIGPDDVFPAPNFWTALTWSTELNASIVKRAIAERWAEDEHMPHVYAAPARWPWSNEAHVEGLKAELAARQSHEERRQAAQAIEARQGGDAEGGSVEDKSAVAAGDVPASKSEDRASSSTPGEVERLRQIAAASTDKLRSLYYHSPRGSTTEVAALAGIEAITALLPHISTAGRGEGSGDLARQAYDLGFAASGEGWNGEYPNNAAETENYARTRTENLARLLNKPAADATNPQDQE